MLDCLKHPSSVIRRPPFLARHPPLIARRLACLIQLPSLFIRRPLPFVWRPSPVIHHQIVLFDQLEFVSEASVALDISDVRYYIRDVNVLLPQKFQFPMKPENYSRGSDDLNFDPYHHPSLHQESCPVQTLSSEWFWEYFRPNFSLEFLFS